MKRGTKHPTIFDRVRFYTPILCRLLARHKHGAPLTTDEIASKSGLVPFQVEALSASVTWEGIDIFILQKFSAACGVDFTDKLSLKRVEMYLKGKWNGSRRVPPPFSYLRRSPLWKTYYLPLMTKFLKSKTPQ